MTLKFRYEPWTGDIQITRNILEKAGVFEAFEINWVADMFAESLGDKNSDYQYVFLEDDDVVIAFSIFGKTVRGGRYDLYWIAVHPEHQGRGYGRQVLEETEKRAKQFGAKHIYIETGSFNTSGNALYKAMGYKLMGVLEKYYTDDNHKHFWGKEFTV